MMHNTSALYAALNQHLIELDEQIKVMKEQLSVRTDVWDEPIGEPDPTRVYRAQTRDGSFVLTPLLAAKAQVLSGMAALKAAEVASKGKR